MALTVDSESVLGRLRHIQSSLVGNLRAEPVLQLGWKDCVKHLFIYWWCYFREPGEFSDLFREDPLTRQSQLLTRLTDGIATLLKAYPQENAEKSPQTPDEFLETARSIHNSVVRAIDAHQLLRVISSKLKRCDSSGVLFPSEQSVVFASDPATALSEALTAIYLDIEDREAAHRLLQSPEDKESLSPRFVEAYIRFAISVGAWDPCSLPKPIVDSALSWADRQEKAMPVRFAIPEATSFSGSYDFGQFAKVHRALMALVYLLDLAPSSCGLWTVTKEKLAAFLASVGGVEFAAASAIMGDLMHQFDPKRTVPAPILPWEPESVVIQPCYATMLGRDMLFLDIGKCKYLPRFERYYKAVTTATVDHVARLVRQLAPDAKVIKEAKLIEDGRTLGDVDVLAVQSSTGAILALEVKALTINEPEQLEKATKQLRRFKAICSERWHIVQDLLVRHRCPVSFEPTQVSLAAVTNWLLMPTRTDELEIVNLFEMEHMEAGSLDSLTQTLSQRAFRLDLEQVVIKQSTTSLYGMQFTYDTSSVGDQLVKDLAERRRK